MKHAKTLAIIPARSGSKGIKNKNILEIRQKPLIAYSILHALECPSIDRVIVSTDSKEIARIAEEFGAEVPFLRPSELAEDHVLDWPVFEHALEYLASEEVYTPQYIVHLRPTAPIRKIEWTEACISLLASNEMAHSVRSVSEVIQHPYRVFQLDDDGYLDPIMKHQHPEPFLLRRQDLPKNYYYNCVIDCTRATTILEMKSMTGSRILPYIIPSDEAFDLDTPYDLEILNRILIDRL